MFTENAFTLVLLFVVLAAIATICLIIGIAALRGGTRVNPRQSSGLRYSAPSRYNGRHSRSDENGNQWDD